MSGACAHLSLDGDLVVDHAGRGQHLATVRLWCAQCEEPFQFLGVPGGVGACPHEPAVDETAVQLRVPVAPSSSIVLDEQLRCPVHGSRR